MVVIEFMVAFWEVPLMSELTIGIELPVHWCVLTRIRTCGTQYYCFRTRCSECQVSVDNMELMMESPPSRTLKINKMNHWISCSSPLLSFWPHTAPQGISNFFHVVASNVTRARTEWHTSHVTRWHVEQDLRTDVPGSWFLVSTQYRVFYSTIQHNFYDFEHPILVPVFEMARTVCTYSGA